MSGTFDYDSYLMFNPEGKIKQLECIKRSTELGNTCLAISNRNVGVMIAHNPLRSALAEPQKKVFEINEKTLFTFSGITNDGLVIVDYLKTSSLVEDVIKDRPFHYLNVFDDLCNDAADRTLTDSSRLYGVAGIMMMDYNGIKIVEFEPTGVARETIGSAIGNRCQSCRTILEKEHESFRDASAEELILVGLKAMKNAHPDNNGEGLKPEDLNIYVLEADGGFKVVDAQDYIQ